MNCKATLFLSLFVVTALCFPAKNGFAASLGNEAFALSPQFAVSRQAAQNDEARLYRQEQFFIASVEQKAQNASAVASLQSQGTAPNSNDNGDDDGFEDYSMESTYIADPFESVNRFFFAFNDWTYANIGDPLWRGYAFVMPQEFRSGINNFFYNLAYPVRFISNLLQGKWKQAGVETSRFVANSTVGFGGLINVTRNNAPIVPTYPENLEQTFGKWGIGEGFYVVLPFLGPSSLRDGIALIGDGYLHPLGHIKPLWHGIALEGFHQFNRFGSLYDNYMTVKQAAVEPYFAFRDGYVQKIRSDIKK